MTFKLIEIFDQEKGIENNPLLEKDETKYDNHLD